jgi:hypothetical protein
MLRLATLFWLLLAATAAGGMYAVKYRVQGLEKALVKLDKATIAEEREIRVLDAEWTYLNRPESLARMNARFLSLVPVTAQQLRTGVADVPMRPPPQAAPKGELVALAAASAPASQPRVTPAALEIGPAAQTVPRDKPPGEPAAQAAPQSRAPHRGKALDALIARIVASR